MRGMTDTELRELRERYAPGCRIELVYLGDPYPGKLTEGCRGTVAFVDDIGTIHVKWDCGSSLGLVPGIDRWRIVES